jgi:hypothetical protein
MSELKTNKVSPATGTALAVGDSGDTITVPSGATFAVSGTMNASSITAGTVATARLGSGTADATTFLRGDQSYASAGGDNTPSFRAQNSADQSISHDTYTKLAANTENWDTDSAYDNSAYRFTVPAGEGGKYLFFYGVYFEGGLAQDKAAEGGIYINGTLDNKSIMRTGASSLLDGRIHGMSFPIALVATDYAEFFVRHHGGGTSTCIANFSYFGAMKLIGI